MSVKSLLAPKSPLGRKVRNIGRHFIALPPRITRNFTQPSDANNARLKDFMLQTYFPQSDNFGDLDLEHYEEHEEVMRALDMHMQRRLEKSRYEFVPWIENARSLKGARILEIGCGTGATTVALAEQGASLTSLDLHEAALEGCKLRCEIHGVPPVTHISANAADIGTLFSGQSFDLILFLATLEHMTIEERIKSLKAAWDLIPQGGHICISQTPNRLWFFDGHTALMPFFNWLPDELAYDYSRFSPREPFNVQFQDMTEASMLSFQRQGRGMSFHEIDLAIGETSRYSVVSDKADFLAKRNPAIAAKRLLYREGGRERVLNAFTPRRHRGFFRKDLDVILQKVS